MEPNKFWIVYPGTRAVTVITIEGTAEVRMGEPVKFHGVRVQIESVFPS
jgi:hypothetical protein